MPCHLAGHAQLTAAPTATHRSSWSVKDIFECRRFDREADFLIEVRASIFLHATVLLAASASLRVQSRMHISPTLQRRIRRLRASSLATCGPLFSSRMESWPLSWTGHACAQRHGATLPSKQRSVSLWRAPCFEKVPCRRLPSHRPLLSSLPLRPGSRWSIPPQNTLSSGKTRFDTSPQRRP
jgi:hypothetical protein